MIGESAQTKVTLPDDATGIVRIEFGGKSYIVAVIDGSVEWSISDLTLGEYSVSATYKGDDKYYGSSDNASFRVLKHDF